MSLFVESTIIYDTMHGNEKFQSLYRKYFFKTQQNNYKIVIFRLK